MRDTRVHALQGQCSSAVATTIGNLRIDVLIITQERVMQNNQDSKSNYTISRLVIEYRSSAGQQQKARYCHHSSSLPTEGGAGLARLDDAVGRRCPRRSSSFAA